VADGTDGSTDDEADSSTGGATTGLLAWTRNPQYLDVVTSVAGVAVLAGSPVVAGYAGVLALACHGVVVAVEEPTLTAAFGEAYRDYRKRVGRWLPRRRD